MEHSPKRENQCEEDNLNKGSDHDSDGMDDDVEILVGKHTVSRVFCSTLETRLDNDEEVEEVVEDVIPGDNSEQPWDLYHFDWKDFPTSPIPAESRREKFSVNNAGPTISSNDPYVIFTNIWDRPIMDHIAAQTNKYAQEVASQLLENNNHHAESFISRWHDTTVDELYVFFGIIMAIGVVVKADIDDYWNTTPNIFCTPGFRMHMSHERFHLLSRCLHFNDNDNMCAQNFSSKEARLFKIQPILSHLNKKFQSLYVPGQNLCLDESLVMERGLHISELIPGMTAQRSIKSYELCECQTGYLWRFDIHPHKKSLMQSEEIPLEEFILSIVLQLVKWLEYKGYTLWMDNFYHSPCLARRLKCLGFDCVGTLRTDRKFVPQVLNSLNIDNMCKGQITGLTSGDVDVLVWRRGRNKVSMISTYHGNRQHTASGSTKPTIIMDYNIMMGGMDKRDQRLALYPLERRQIKVWYKKLFRRLLNISIENSYVIHKKNNFETLLSHRQFRMNLIKSLLTNHATPSPVSSPTRKMDVSHRLGELPMRKHQRLRRNCTVCKKLIRTFCVGCGKAVCIEPCFLSLHS